MKESILAIKSLDFAEKIYYLCKRIDQDKKEKVISNQLLRSGTSIGANISEAQYAQSASDFISKMSIAQKEASETRYWLTLLKRISVIDERDYKVHEESCTLLIKMLAKTIKTTKDNNKKKN